MRTAEHPTYGDTDTKTLLWGNCISNGKRKKNNIAARLIRVVQPSPPLWTEGRAVCLGVLLTGSTSTRLTSDLQAWLCGELAGALACSGETLSDRTRRAMRLNRPPPLTPICLPEPTGWRHRHARSETPGNKRAGLRSAATEPKPAPSNRTNEWECIFTQDFKGKCLLSKSRLSRGKYQVFCHILALSSVSYTPSTEFWGPSPSHSAPAGSRL